MDNNQNRDNEKKRIKYICYVGLGYLLGWSLFRITNLNENDTSKSAQEYLESLESNHDLNERLDNLIEGFTMKEGSTRLGDDFEEYLGISLNPYKKLNLNLIANELDTVKSQLDHTSGSIFAFETWLSDVSLQEAKEIVSNNIISDNDWKFNCSISFNYGKDYGWVVADDSYQIFDEMLNEFVSSYEYLNNRSTNLSENAKEYENIMNGVLKSSICDIVLDENSHHVRIEIPNDVKELVKKK